MKANEYIKPLSANEAVEESLKVGSVIVGGGTFIKNSKKTHTTIIDLEKLNLTYIKEKRTEIIIGSYTTLREIEKSQLFKVFAGGLLSECCSVICGVQLRNMATIGGTIGGRYGFSDLIPVLLVLNTKVNFLDGTSMGLNDYLENKTIKRIIKEIVIDKEDAKGVFKYVKRNAMDFSMINICMIKVENEYRIAIGARPGIAKRAPGVEQYLNINKIIDGPKIIEYLFKDMNMGSDLKASREYRESVSASLLMECIQEVK